MPSSDEVPAVTGGALWELVLAGDKERFGTGALLVALLPQEALVWGFQPGYPYGLGMCEL